MGERAERNAARLREGYEAFGAGDLAKVAEMFSPDLVWHTPDRHGQLGGDHKGWDEVAGFFLRSMELSEGTFRIEILDILASDDRAAGYVHVTANAKGRLLDEYPVHLYRFDEEGIVQEVTQYHLNADGPDAFWA